MLAALAPIVESTVAGSRAAVATSRLGAATDAAAKLAKHADTIFKVGNAIDDASKKILGGVSEHEQLLAQFERLTGSAEKAKQAMFALEDTAAGMSFGPREVEKAFIDMVNLGLKPSERALRAYGDMAAGLDKPLDDVVQAIGGAVNGNFRGLQELNIGAKAAGDEVTFTVQGVSTTVKNSSDDIQGYFRSIADSNFSGAMAAHMGTAKTAMDKAADAADHFWVAFVEQSGVADGTKNLSNWIAETRQYTARAVEQNGVLTGSALAAQKALKDAFGIKEVAPNVETTAQAISRVKQQIDSTKYSLGQLEAQARAWHKAGTDFNKATNNSKPEYFKGQVLEFQKEYVAAKKHLDELEAKLKELESKPAPAEQDRLAGLVKNAKVATEESRNASGTSGSAHLAVNANYALGAPDDIFSRIEECLCNATGDIQSKEHALTQPLSPATAEAANGPMPVPGTDGLEDKLNWKAEEYATLEEMELQHKARLGDIDAEAELKRREFEQMSFRRKTKDVLGQMMSLTEGVSKQNRAMFEINKAASIANAVMNAYEGISLTLKSYPYPINIGLAALHAAAAFQQVKSIASTSFGGGAPSGGGVGGGAAGGGAPSLSGVGVAKSSGAAGISSSTQESKPSEPQRQVQIIVQGNMVGNQDFADYVVDTLRKAEEQDKM